MKNNIITKIWNIRGMLDKAVQKQDRELAEKAQAKFNKIYETELYHKSFAIATVNQDYDNVEQLCKDRDCNFALLAYRFAMIKKEMRNVEATPEHPFQFVSILDLIWYTRGMYDLLNEKIQNREVDIKSKNILANGVVYNLNEAYNCLDQLSGTAEDICNKYVINQLLNNFVEKYSEYITENVEEIQLVE